MFCIFRFSERQLLLLIEFLYFKLAENHKQLFLFESCFARFSCTILSFFTFRCHLICHRLPQQSPYVCPFAMTLCSIFPSPCLLLCYSTTWSIFHDFLFRLCNFSFSHFEWLLIFPLAAGCHFCYLYTIELLCFPHGNFLLIRGINPKS